MPKVTMEFNLPDEQFDLACAEKGYKHWKLLNELATQARSQYKYQGNNKLEWIQVYEWILKICAEENVDPMVEPN